MKAIFYPLLLIPVVLLSGCKHNNENYNDQQTDYIEFSNVIAQLQKATNDHNKFILDDQMGLYIVERETSTNASTSEDMSSPYRENILVKSDGSTGVIIGDKIPYPISDKNTDVYSYYPYNSAANTGAKKELRAVTILTDQSVDENLRQSDFKIARQLNWVNPKSQKTSVPLNFQHILSQVNVELINGEGIFELTPLERAVVALEGIPTSGTYNFMNQTYTQNTANYETITPNGTLVKGEGNKATRLVGLAAILPPRTTSQAPYVLNVKLDGVNHRMPISGELKSGYQYTYLVTVSHKGMTIQTSIQQWNDGGIENNGQAIMWADVEMQFTTPADVTLDAKAEFTVENDSGATMVIVANSAAGVFKLLTPVDYFKVKSVRFKDTQSGKYFNTVFTNVEIKTEKQIIDIISGDIVFE